MSPKSLKHENSEHRVFGGDFLYRARQDSLADALQPNNSLPRPTQEGSLPVSGVLGESPTLMSYWLSLPRKRKSTIDVKNDVAGAEENEAEGEDDTTVFSVSVFLDQFFVHFFYPLSIPYCLMVHGLTLSKNQKLIGAGMWFQLVTGLMFWALVGLAAYHSFLRGRATTWIGIGCFVAHKLSVAAKYGLMDRSNYDQMATQPQESLAKRLDLITQVLSILFVSLVTYVGSC